MRSNAPNNNMASPRSTVTFNFSTTDSHSVSLDSSFP